MNTVGRNEVSRSPGTNPRRGIAAAMLLIDLGAILLLLAVLVGVYQYDQSAPGISAPEEIATEIAPEPESPPPPPPDIVPPAENLPPIDPVPRIAVHFSRNDRFGLVTTTGNPDDPDDDHQRLTFSPAGTTNNTRIAIDDRHPLLGELLVDTANRQTGEGRYEVEFRSGDLRIVREIRLVPGKVSRRMDQIEVNYRISNTGDRPHTVGLREMLDTLIGRNDGVPFIVPGTDGIVNSPRTYSGQIVPDSVRALERPDLADPGVIVELGFRVEQGESPAEIVLTHWPGPNADWEYSRNAPISGDSAIGIYYEVRPLAPGESRRLGYTYGLGTISSSQSKNARLSLTAGGPFHAGGKFWLTALVQNPREGQSVRIVLPAGLSFDQEHAESKPVPASSAASFTQVSWLLLAARDCVGEREIEAVLEPENAKERQVLSIGPPDARLTLVSRGAAVAGKSLWISAVVRNPKVGQRLELTVPAGITLAPGHAPDQPVPADKEIVQVNWLVRIAAKSAGKSLVRVKLLPEAIEDNCELNIEAGNLLQ